MGGYQWGWDKCQWKVSASHFLHIFNGVKPLGLIWVNHSASRFVHLGQSVTESVKSPQHHYHHHHTTLKLDDSELLCPSGVYIYHKKYLYYHYCHCWQKKEFCGCNFYSFSADVFLVDFIPFNNHTFIILYLGQTEVTVVDHLCTQEWRHGPTSTSGPVVWLMIFHLIRAWTQRSWILETTVFHIFICSPAGISFWQNPSCFRS